MTGISCQGHGENSRFTSRGELPAGQGGRRGRRRRRAGPVRACGRHRGLCRAGRALLIRDRVLGEQPGHHDHGLQLAQGVIPASRRTPVARRKPARGLAPGPPTCDASQRTILAAEGAMGAATPTQLIDNERRARYRVGASSPARPREWHRHAFDYVVVPVTTGQLHLKEPNGERTIDIVTGTPYFREEGRARRHQPERYGRRDLSSKSR